MVCNVSFLKMVQQTSLGSETASLHSEVHSADNLYQRSLCLSINPLSVARIFLAVTIQMTVSLFHYAFITIM